MNNIRKQYLSDYYIVVYGRNELDLENTTINVASEINKCGLNTKLLGRKETAIFLKYSFSRNFDEREIKEIEDNRLIAWVKQRENVYTIGIEFTKINDKYAKMISEMADDFNDCDTRILLKLPDVCVPTCKCWQICNKIQKDESLFEK